MVEEEYHLRRLDIENRKYKFYGLIQLGFLKCLVFYIIDNHTSLLSNFNMINKNKYQITCGGQYCYVMNPSNGIIKLLGPTGSQDMLRTETKPQF